MESILVNIQLTTGTQIYNPRYISFGDNCVIGCGNSRNLSFLLGYCAEEEAEERKKPIQAQMDAYNKAVQGLWAIPGFAECFAHEHSYMPIDDIENIFGEQAADYARGVCRITNCYPDLQVVRGALKLRNTKFLATFEISGDSYSFDVEHAPEDANLEHGKMCFLDRTDDFLDLRSLVFLQLVKDEIMIGDYADHLLYLMGLAVEYGGTDSKIYLGMEYVVKMLISNGYMSQYSLYANQYLDIWECNTKRQNKSVIFSILDPDYKNDQTLMRRIVDLLNSLYVYDDEEENYIESSFNLDQLE